MSDTERTAEGHGFKLTPGPADHKPNHDHHTWGMFAGLAVELGGYGDVELVEPYTGRTFWFQPNQATRDAETGFEFHATLILALNAAKEAGFFDDEI